MCCHWCLIQKQKTLTGASSNGPLSAQSFFLSFFLPRSKKEQEQETLRRALSLQAGDRTVAAVHADLEDAERRVADLERTRDEAGRRLAKLRDDVAALRARVHSAKEEALNLGAAAEKRAALGESLSVSAFHIFKRFVFLAILSYYFVCIFSFHLDRRDPNR